MTDLISPTAETRVIPHQAETTAVTPIEGTVRLNPPPRRPQAGTGRHDTGEQPLFPTGAELAVWGDAWGAHAVAPFQPPPDGTPPPLPPIPAPPKPSWAGPVGTYPPIGPQPQPGPQPGPMPGPVPPPVVPGMVEPPTERLPLDERRPKGFQPRHRACRCLPIPAVVGVSAGTSALTFAALLAVSWQAAQ